MDLTMRQDDEVLRKEGTLDWNRGKKITEKLLRERVEEENGENAKKKKKKRNRHLQDSNLRVRTQCL